MNRILFHHFEEQDFVFKGERTKGSNDWMHRSRKQILVEYDASKQKKLRRIRCSARRKPMKQGCDYSCTNSSLFLQIFLLGTKAQKLILEWGRIGFSSVDGPILSVKRWSRDPIVSFWVWIKKRRTTRPGLEKGPLLEGQQLRFCQVGRTYDLIFMDSGK